LTWFIQFLCSIDDDTFLETTNVGSSFSLAYVDEENGYEEEKEEGELKWTNMERALLKRPKLEGVGPPTTPSMTGCLALQDLV
jgi:hypothetical protein